MRTSSWTMCKQSYKTLNITSFSLFKKQGEEECAHVSLFSFDCLFDVTVALITIGKQVCTCVDQVHNLWRS